MVFYSELSVDGQMFKVLHCKYGFEQHISELQRTCSKPEGGVIDLVIEARRGDSGILGWMLSNPIQESDTIIFARDAMKTSFMKVVFTNAFYVVHREDSEHHDGENLTVSFSIVYGELSVNGAIHKNSWK